MRSFSYKKNSADDSNDSSDLMCNIGLKNYASHIILTTSMFLIVFNGQKILATVLV